jgi:uncharacterized damage-inducible protein DinB
MWINHAVPMHGPLESPVVAPVTALVRVLDELCEVVGRIPDDVFACPPAGRPSGSVGAHVRHCLDHVSALLEGISSSRMSYDHRARGTHIETSRAAALAHIRSQIEAVLDLDPRVLSRTVRLQVTLDARGTHTVVQSTVARELAFVIAHTIHHNATMGLLLSEAGTSLPHRFGVAPSTPAVPGTAAQKPAGSQAAGFVGHPPAPPDAALQLCAR